MASPQSAYTLKMSYFRPQFDAEDADADGGDEHVPQFFHHYGHGFADAFLCVHWRDTVWNGEIRTSGVEVCFSASDFTSIKCYF